MARVKHYNQETKQWEYADIASDGTPGYTPVRGTDYWTEADKAEIVEDVISRLPIYNGEVVAE